MVDNGQFNCLTIKYTRNRFKKEENNNEEHHFQQKFKDNLKILKYNYEPCKN